MAPPGAARALEEAHLASRSTRGPAVAVAEMDFGAGEVRYAGFGNISGVLLGPERAQSMVSMNGMSSDGLATHWSLEQYPGLALRYPSLVAGVLHRDHFRRRDDVTVVAARLASRS